MSITLEEECIGRILQQQPYDRTQGSGSVPTLYRYKILFAKRKPSSGQTKKPHPSTFCGRVWTASPEGNSFRVKDSPEEEWDSEKAEPLGLHTRIPKTIWLDGEIHPIEKIREFPHFLWVFTTKGSLTIPSDTRKPMTFMKPRDLFIYATESTATT